MSTTLENWQESNLVAIEEALTQGLIIRVISSTGGRRQLHVGLPRALEHNGYRGTVVLRDLADRTRRRVDLVTITAVEIIGVYLKDYEPGQPAVEE